MKFAIPEISWHNRDPVLSVDFQPKANETDPLRLATAGTDTHVLIWYVSTTDTGSVNLDVAADLTRHQKAVNVVRWSPSGQYLGSGDDESIIFIWHQKTDKDNTNTDQGEEQYKETWVIYKTLRGHMEDVLDICWSVNSLQLASGSVDNKLLVWDVPRAKYNAIVTDHKGFVQGVAWDPKGQFIASASTDRMFRTFDIATKKVKSRCGKAVLPFPKDHPLHEVKVRLFHDDTLQTYYRRLQFSPDGLLIAVPAGKIEPEQGKVDMKPINAIYIFTRYNLKVPVCALPCGEAALACRWSPIAYTLRTDGPPPAFPINKRYVLAVATKRSVLLYDTQQKTPIALISNIHYTRLTDLTWSNDGLTLVASSTDGYCSVISFNVGELGDPCPVETAPEPMEISTVEPALTKGVSPKEETPKMSTKKINSFIKFKTPEEKLKGNTPKQKTPVKLDILVESAMPSWSDNSSSEIIKSKEQETMVIDKTDTDKSKEIVVIEDSEDFKLVYEDTECDKSADSISPGDEIKDASNVNNVEKSNELKESPKMISANSTVKTPEPTKKRIQLTHLTNKISSNSQKEDKSKESNSEKTENKAEKSKKSPKSQSKDVKEVKTPEQNKKRIAPTMLTSNTSFFKQAKVMDIKEQVEVKSAQSPKAPRRVNLITLSSPKNAKKKC